MKYISVSLYRKVINHALSEGLTRDELIDLPTPIDFIDDVQAIPADHLFEIHEIFDKKLGPGFAVRVG